MGHFNPLMVPFVSLILGVREFFEGFMIEVYDFVDTRLESNYDTLWIVKVFFFLQHGYSQEERVEN